MSEEAFIYEAIRTPRGKQRNGSLNEVKPVNLVVGLVIGVQFVVTVMTRGYAGQLTDSHGGKRAALQGATGCASAGLMYLAATLSGLSPEVRLGFVVAGRLAAGFGESQFVTGCVSWSIASVGPQRAGMSMSWTGIAMFAALSIGAPIGMFAGTYLAEYGKHDRLTSVIRFINDILLSAPSIIIGLFIYGAVVVPMGSFSALAGSLALAVIVIPVVVRTTEDMLLLVPNPLREAASALGLPRSLVIKKIAYRAARSGLITGVLLATARVAGETAPLLFTALSNQFFSLSLTRSMANLPVTINNFVQSPYDYWKQLAWSGALLITLTVLALNIGARVLGAERTAK